MWCSQRVPLRQWGDARFPLGLRIPQKTAFSIYWDMFLQKPRMSDSPVVLPPASFTFLSAFSWMTYDTSHLRTALSHFFPPSLQALPSCARQSHLRNRLNTLTLGQLTHGTIKVTPRLYWVLNIFNVNYLRMPKKPGQVAVWLHELHFP